MEENNREYEISLMDLIKILLKKWYIIAIVTVLFTTAAGFWAFVQLDNTYTATSSMIIQDLNNEENELTSLTLGTKLVDTYNAIAVSERVLNQVREDYELDYTNDQLRAMITLTSQDDTIVVSLEVESYSAEDSATIANGLVTVIRTVTLQYDGLETVEQLDVAVVPTEPSGPNRLLILLVGIIGGGAVGSIAVLMREFLDKKLKSPQDIENELGIRLLATIPFYDLEEVE